MSDELLAIALIRRRASTLRLGAGLENGTSSGQSGAESSRRGLPPADDSCNEFCCRRLELFPVVLKVEAVNRRVAGSNPA
jgi:hypothetical protein